MFLPQINLKGVGKQLWEVMDVYSLDGGDFFMDTHLTPNSLSCID